MMCTKDLSDGRSSANCASDAIAGAESICRAATRPRILFVDDELLLVEMISFLLSHCGFDVRTGTTAVEADGILEDGSWAPDLLIVDSVFGDGVAGLEWARSVANGRPVLLFSGADDMEKEASRMQMEFLKKGSNPIDLIMRVRSILASRGDTDTKSCEGR